MGEVARDCVEQGIPPRLVALAHATQVAVELATGDEVVQGELAGLSKPRSSIALTETSGQPSQEGVSIQPSRMPGTRRLLAEPT